MADLAALLDKEASAEIDAILSEARTRASEIVAEAKDDAEALLAQRGRAAQQQYEAALVRAKSAAQLEASSLKLRAQQTAIEQVFHDVTAKVEALTRDTTRYGPVLGSLLDEAIAGVGKDNVSAIAIHPEDEALATEAARKHGLAEKLEPDPAIRGGVRVRAAKSNVSIENTLFGRLAAVRDDLASEVAATLLRKEA